MNRLENIINRPEPTLAVVITEPLNDSTIQDIGSLGCVAEIRADKFPIHNPEYLSEQIARLKDMPLLLTIRSQTEKGNWTGSEDERLQLISELLPEVGGVDVELAAPILPDVISAAHSLGKLVIASSHNFKITPSFMTFETQLEQSQEAGANYAKFATSAQTFKDYRRVAEFTLTHKESGVIVVGMDKWGPRSRISLPWLGSRLTYASVGSSPVAKGQMNYQETHARLIKRYPAYARLFN